MKKVYIEIPEESWGIIFCFAFDSSDFGDIEAICKSFGMSKLVINNSLNILSTFNSGMTISNDDLKMSAVFIGKSTSNGQFWNTVSHECAHVVDAISRYYKVGCETEDRAYLQGFLFQRIVEEIAEPCY
jgi:hypothetical protein